MPIVKCNKSDMSSICITRCPHGCPHGVLHDGQKPFCMSKGECHINGVDIKVQCKEVSDANNTEAVKT